MRLGVLYRFHFVDTDSTQTLPVYVWSTPLSWEWVLHSHTSTSKHGGGKGYSSPSLNHFLQSLTVSYSVEFLTSLCRHFDGYRSSEPADCIPPPPALGLAAPDCPPISSLLYTIINQYFRSFIRFTDELWNTLL